MKDEIEKIKKDRQLEDIMKIIESRASGHDTEVGDEK